MPYAVLAAALVALDQLVKYLAMSPSSPTWWS